MFWGPFVFCLIQQMKFKPTQWHFGRLPLEFAVHTKNVAKMHGWAKETRHSIAKHLLNKSWVSFGIGTSFQLVEYVYACVCLQFCRFKGTEGENQNCRSKIVFNHEIHLSVGWPVNSEILHVVICVVPFSFKSSNAYWITKSMYTYLD